MADREPPPTSDDGEGAPAYIVSMSALWTILLSFFIIMVTMVDEQECGFMAAGTGSFIQQMTAKGMPGMLDGTRNAFTFGDKRPNYALLPEDIEAAKANEGIGDRRILKPPDKRLEDVHKLKTRPVMLEIPVQVQFPPGTSKLNWQAARELDRALRQVRNTSHTITIEAYVDPVASFKEPLEHPQDAWELSAERAAAVARYLHKKGGISYKQLTPVGYGVSRPVAHRRNDLTSRENDRVKIVIYQQ